MEENRVKENAATRQEDTAAVFSVMAKAAAASIAAGGVLHGLGMIHTVMLGLSMPWWYWAVFLTAVAGYEASAVLMLSGKTPGFVFAFLGPMVGGSLIILGFVFPASGLLCLIPGTYANEITAAGFLTLVIEPIAVAFSLLFLLYGPKKGRS